MHYIEFFNKKGRFSDIQAERGWGTNFRNHFFFFFFHYGSRSIFEHRPKMIRRKKGQEKHPNIYIYHI